MKTYLITLLISSAFIDLNAQVQIGNAINGEAPGDLFGYSVSISSDGRRVVVGAPSNAGTGDFSGSVRVFEENEGEWNQIGGDIDGEAERDNFGISVSISSDGKRIVLGAHHNDGNEEDSGHVRVFEQIDGNWVQVGSSLEGEAVGDLFGSSVSISSDGSRVAISSPENQNSTGQVKVYEENNENWVQVGSSLEGEAAGDYFGSSISMSSDGKRVVIGAPGNDGNGVNSGHARIFNEIGGIWVQIGNDIEGESILNSSGGSVSISSDGKIVAIGSPWFDDYRGQVRVYKEDNGQWIKLGNNIIGEGSLDYCGSAVSLSSEGTRIAIGAFGNSLFGAVSGHVRIFGLVNNEWIQIDSNINGEFGDESGWSVSLSSEGTRVAVGAPGSSDNGIRSGQVKIYELSVNTVPVEELILKNSLTLTVSPNPADEKISLEFNEAAETLNILSPSGSIVRNIAMKGNLNHLIDLSGIAPGIYLLQVKTKRSTITRKIIKL